MIAGGSDEASAPSGESKGFWASLADMFVPDDDRAVYAEGIRRGGFLVTVTGYAGSKHDVALDILDDEGSIDLDERTGLGIRRLVALNHQRGISRIDS